MYPIHVLFCCTLVWLMVNPLAVLAGPSTGPDRYPISPIPYVAGFLLLFLVLTVITGWMKARELGRRRQELKQTIEPIPDATPKAGSAASPAHRGTGELLGVLSQQIRDPMNGIIGMTELALATQLSREQEEYLQQVKRSANSLLTLVNEVLDYTRIDAGKVELEQIPFSLRESLRNAISTFTMTAEANGLHFTWNIHDDVPDALIGDPSRLRQIIVNLLGNAIRNTAQGEVKLTIKAGAVGPDESWLHFVVEDTGNGIPDDQQALLFECGALETNLTTPNELTAGLGRTIAAQLVHLMGGEIHVQSPVQTPTTGSGGPGTAFSFMLPFGVQKTSGTEAGPIREISLRDTPVLIIDDCPTDRERLESILTLWEMKPVAAKNAVDAMMIMEDARNAGRHFPLAILDANLPEIDGFALAEEIKRSEYFGTTKLIMLTSAAMRGDGQRCRTVGISAYLPKPVDQSDLLHTVIAVLDDTLGDGAATGLITRHSINENRKSLHILLKEDNAVNRKFLTRLLEKWGHRVSAASDLSDIAATVDSTDVDLVLLDIQDSQADALATVQALRAREKSTGKYVRLFAMDAAVDRDAARRFYEAGFDGVIAKPVRVDELFMITRISHSGAERPEFLLMS